MSEVYTGTSVPFWRAAAAELKKIRSLAGGGLLAAVGVALEAAQIVISKLLQIGFSFLATALSGYLYGPLVAGLSAMVIDVLGFMLRPTGPFFFGFILNAFLTGFLYGLFFYRRRVTLWRTLAAEASVMLVVSFLLNPIWLHMMYGQAWLPLILLRIPKNAVMLPVNTALLYALLRLTEKNKANGAAL